MRSLVKIRAVRRSDKADSTLVTFLLVLPLFLSFIFTMIDTSVYFANRSIIQQAGRDAARTAAIYGGTGDGTYQSPLEQAYGEPYACTATEDAAKLANDTAVECGVWLRLKQGAGLTSVQFPNDAVRCGPYKANQVGETTFCEISWTYDGIPGSVLSFINRPGGTNGSVLQRNQTRVTSESEVGMINNCFVRRATPTICDG